MGFGFGLGIEIEKGLEWYAHLDGRGEGTGGDAAVEVRDAVAW